jgi:hypothetical protein
MILVVISRHIVFLFCFMGLHLPNVENRKSRKYLLEKLSLDKAVLNGLAYFR